MPSAWLNPYKLLCYRRSRAIQAPAGPTPVALLTVPGDAILLQIAPKAGGTG